MTILNEVINKQSNSSLRLIVHIGAGKTGTTSIQRALVTQQKSLIEQGFWYLGLMLENAPVKRYPWQRALAFEELMSLTESEITAQLADVLSSSVDIIASSGCKTAILSNEAFLNRPKVHRAIIPVFEQLAEKGWEIEIVTYIRRHDAWMQSAYQQWGLKHKTYKGELLPFSKWRKRSNCFFNDSLQIWMNAKGCKNIVHNFDAVTNVVDDFYALVGLERKKIGSIRANKSPTSEELLLRSLFNNQSQDTVLPSEFERLMNVEKLDFNRSVTTFLSNYLPSDADLMKVVEDCAEDRAEINRILNNNGQPPLDISALKLKSNEVDLAKITAILFEILANQARKIEHLESKLNEITLSSN